MTQRILILVASLFFFALIPLSIIFEGPGLGPVGHATTFPNSPGAGNAFRTFNAILQPLELSSGSGSIGDIIRIGIDALLFGGDLFRLIWQLLVLDFGFLKYDTIGGIIRWLMLALFSATIVYGITKAGINRVIGLGRGSA